MKRFGFCARFQAFRAEPYSFGVGDVMGISPERSSQRALHGCDSRVCHCEAHSHVTESDSEFFILWSLSSYDNDVTCVTLFRGNEK
jgi:hypothetical protein